MPALSRIVVQQHEDLELKNLKWFSEIVNIRKGGLYLLAGEPGIGKTTLSVNILGDLCRMGHKCLYLTNEQSPEDIRSTASRVLSENGEIPKDIQNNFIAEKLRKIEDLEFWNDHIFHPGQNLSDVSVIVIDSVQGGGTNSTSRRSYNALCRFGQIAQRHKKTVIMIGHITKNGKIAGPKDLEHAVDAVLYIRRAYNMRPMFVTKNRFGQARLEPEILVMDENGILKKSPHIEAGNSISYGLGISNLGGELIEMQANVRVPRYGESAKIRSPYLPSNKVRQVMDAINDVEDMDVGTLSHDINCYVKSGKGYNFGLDLPLAVSIVGSYLKKNIPDDAIFIGEVDLSGRVRSLSDKEVQCIIDILGYGNERLIGFKKIYISSETYDKFEEDLILNGVFVKVERVDNLKDVFNKLWFQNKVEV